MPLPFLILYLAVGMILLVLLAGFDGPTVNAALRDDLRSLRRRGLLELATVGPVWLAGAVVAWPVVAACEAITWREKTVARRW
jgi:hypothetical protein